MAKERGPTWLYIIICEHSAALYVGIATDVERRLDQHWRDKPWWSDVRGVLAYQLPTREIARQEELRLIRQYRPIYNIEGVPSPDPLGQIIQERRFDVIGGSQATRQWRF